MHTPKPHLVFNLIYTQQEQARLAGVTIGTYRNAINKPPTPAYHRYMRLISQQAYKDLINESIDRPRQSDIYTATAKLIQQLVRRSNRLVAGTVVPVDDIAPSGGAGPE